MSADYANPDYVQGTQRLGLRMHPAVLDRRLRDLLALAVVSLVPLALGLAIMVFYHRPNPILLFGGLAAVAGTIFLLVSTRYEVTLTAIAVYLGVFDGPIKLEASSAVASGMRNILILAVALGMLLRFAARRQKASLPPLAVWVLAFVAFTLAEALNPHTLSIVKSLGGWRQQLEWVPCFFFGYMLLRSAKRLRQLFIILGLIALANGLVATYQSRLSPHQLASWGPGYKVLMLGGEGNGITGRTYGSGGVAHVRPPALGSDSGFGGGVGGLALPCMLALMSVGYKRRRWLPPVLCLGAILGIATAASRTSVVVGVAGLLAYVVFSLLAGLRVGRLLMGVVAVGLIVVVVGSVLLSTEGSSIFARQETLTSLERAEETGGNGKTEALSEIPDDLIHQPFGYGLGVSGSVSGFGGKTPAQFEGQLVIGGSSYSELMKEVGFPGLLLWVGLTINVLLLAVRWLRRVADMEVRTYLVGMMAAYAALTVQGQSGPTLAVTIGAFLWLVPGVAAYWFKPGPDTISPALPTGSAGPAGPRLATVPA